ncbi:AI-2E family transporter [Xylanibacter rodentium]|jgi:predicted PurR-regulated permease PerM|uniref:AI-2E family transporter n=1 Tax=Xylanibacter rodentium TaxID=2736289 RepID=A0ABX2AZL1_9BACT|nr:AI-2E family transporter [Xylanibacter rodentium]NPE12436.1 AI-2E family transporter [Prevotella sp. PJ1A]NPE15125.1 AI-2E family transporter [Xylanibacter rodentium]NPE39556.1 AI-2E family transporter [Prevotella sp. PCJ2]
MTITFDRFIRWMLGALLAAAIIYMVNYLSNVLLPFFIAWLLAYLLYPTVRFVQYRMHVPGRVLSIIVTLVFVTVVIGCIVWMIIPPMIEQFERLGYLLGRYLHDTIHVNNFPAAIQLWLRENDETITSLFRNEDIMEAVKETMPKVFAVIGKTANIIMSIIASLITLLYMFFILKDYEKLSAGFIRLFPPKNRPFWRELTDDVERELDSYIRGQSLVALCIGVLCCIGFTVIGFPMAIGLGIMIGLMSLIPYVHSLALIPIVFLSALKAADTGQNFWVVLASALAVFAIVQVITDMVLVPKIMGKAMGLNPAVLLLSLSVWGSLLGFLGLIIALPLTTLIIAYYQRYVTKEGQHAQKDITAT